jgi:predicted dinucleotide-binding enzyme
MKLNMKKYKIYFQEDTLKSVVLIASDEEQAKKKAEELLKEFGSSLWDYEKTFSNSLEVVQLKGAEVISLNSRKKKK